MPVPVGDSSTNPQDPSPSDINPSVDNCPKISPIYPQILPKSLNYLKIPVYLISPPKLRPCYWIALPKTAIVLSRVFGKPMNLSSLGTLSAVQLLNMQSTPSIVRIFGVDPIKPLPYKRILSILWE